MNQAEADPKRIIEYLREVWGDETYEQSAFQQAVLEEQVRKPKLDPKQGKK